MAEIRRLFVPFGELKPDGKLFNNDGLLVARNIIPVYENYVASQVWVLSGDQPSDEPYGLHVHSGGGSTWYAYLGTITKLYQSSSSFVLTDKTRAAGGAYATSGAGGENGWQSTSFGDAVIMTNYVDDPQLLTSPAAANFVKLAQSGGGNPGMDPKAKFVAAVRGNLFLANLNLAGAFDTLPAGANPTVVAWSQSESVRQFGSFAVTPQLTGTGYQPLSYDFGHINGMIGGEYALISMQKGWVRADGPPYVFRPTAEGQSCRFPNSIIRLDEDVYFWGPSGPSVLRGGEGPVEVLGSGRVARTLIDNITGFSTDYSIDPSIAIRHVGVARDVANGLIVWSFTSRLHSGDFRIGDLLVVYSVRDDRFSFVENLAIISGGSTYGGVKPGVLFLKSRPDIGGTWSPGRDFVCVSKWQKADLSTNHNLGLPDYFAGSVPTEWGGNPSLILTRAYQQLDSDRTTRIRRVRPVYSRVSAAIAVTATIVIASKNVPSGDAAASSSSTTLDAHGWVTTPGTKFADFHQVQVGLAAATGDNSVVVELEGFELEYEVGGVRSA